MLAGELISPNFDFRVVNETTLAKQASNAF